MRIIYGVSKNARQKGKMSIDGGSARGENPAKMIWGIRIPETQCVPVTLRRAKMC